MARNKKTCHRYVEFGGATTDLITTILDRYSVPQDVSRDCNPGPFFNPGISGLENANPGTPGFNLGIETACKSGSIVGLTLGLRSGSPPVFINGIFSRELFGIFYAYLWTVIFASFSEQISQKLSSLMNLNTKNPNPWPLNSGIVCITHLRYTYTQTQDQTKLGLNE